MVADTRTRNTVITIDILGPSKNVIQAGIAVDVVVESVRLGCSQFNTQSPDGYHPCTGSITLKAGNNVGFATSTNPRDTADSPPGAQIYAYGNRVNISMADTTGTLQLLSSLYITETPDPNNLRSPKVTLQLGDEGQLIDHSDTPEEDRSNVTLGTPRTANVIANNVLAEEGLAVSGDSVTVYPISFPAQKTTTESWPRFIGGLMATRGYSFWFDRSGSPRYTELSFDQTAPVLSLTIGGDNGDEVKDERGWLLSKDALFPPEELTVIGQGAIAVEIDNPVDRPYSRPGDGFTALSGDFRQEWDFGITPEYTETRTERQAEKLILPEITTLQSGIATGSVPNTSTALRDSLDHTRVLEYENVSRKKDREVITQKVPRGLAGGDAYRGTDSDSSAFNLLTTTTSISIEYSRLTGRMTRRETSRTMPWCLVPWTGDRPTNYEVNRFTVREVYRRTETWEEAQGNVFGGDSSTRTQRYNYESVVLQPAGVVEEDYQGVNADALVTDHRLSETDVVDSPPQPDYQDSEYTRANTQYSGSASFVPLAGAAYKNKKETIRLQGPYAVSDAQMTFVARLLGLYRHGRALGARFVGAVPDWLFGGYFPGARIDVTVDGVISAYLIDGWELISDISGTFWGCSLVFVGVVGAQPDIITPPVAVTFGLTGNVGINLSVAATFEPIIDITGGVNIPLSVAGDLGELLTLTGGANIPLATGGLIAETLDLTGEANIPLAAGGNLSVDDVDAANFIARLGGTYTTAQTDAITNFFVALKTDATYSKLQAAWIYSLQTAADGLLNIKGTNFTSINTLMTHSPSNGFTGNGSNAFINTNFTPSSAGVVGQDNISMGYYSNTAAPQGSTDMGAHATGGATLFIASSFPVSPDTLFAAANSVDFTTTPNSAGDGLFILNRAASTGFTVSRNNVSLLTSTEASTGTINRPIYVAARNNGTILQPSTRQYSFAFVGESLTAAEQTTLFNAVETLLLNI